MQQVGFFTMLLGGAAIVFGWVYDISIGEVANLSLLQQQLLLTQIGIGLLIVGAFFLATGVITDRVTLLMRNPEATEEDITQTDNKLALLAMCLVVIGFGCAVSLSAGMTGRYSSSSFPGDMDASLDAGAAETALKESCESGKRAGLKMEELMGCEPYW